MSFPTWPPFTGKDSFRATLTAIPPYTEATAQRHLDDPYGRLAWLIPVRGQLPWEGTTPAVLVADSPETVNVPPQPPNHDLPCPPTIVWTRAALRNLWSFLQALRDAGNLGPLSLAFSAPPPHTTGDWRGSTATDEVRRPGGRQEPADGLPSLAPRPRSRPPSSRASARSESDARRHRLRRCAYLEVHHDARYTRGLRGLLHSWHHRQDGAKVFPLRGATLVLLDERDRGLVLW
ncbi:hypothetical protein BD413DRAFT_608492 [Trametes elegans]|nr:hypothetical protein BD413DRAFT_608492 [Trametes elegans]